MFVLSRKMLLNIIFVSCVAVLAATASLAQLQNESSPGAPSNNNLTPSMVDPVPVTSTEGKFEVMMPPGCFKIHKVDPRVSEDGLISFVYVYCDRNEQKGEGFSISAWLGAEDADVGNLEYEDLKFRIKESIGKFGVEVVKQKPLEITLPTKETMTGIDLLALTPDKVGQVWLRGWVAKGRIYLLVAWRSSGELFQQPGVTEFFDSFKPM